jgi:predicted FMN-binding regulatory protein PaiB
VVIKGTAYIVEDNEEKTQALNSLMKKYQKEGKYEILHPSMPSVHEVAVIKIVPKEMRGKYKIGQHWAPAYRLKMAKHIIEREEKQYAETILNTMGISISPDGRLIIREEPLM